jgi:hypothetical protein
MQIQVTSNAPALAAAFQRLAADQLPFATAVALTRVAQDARDKERKQLDATFKVRSRRRIEQGIQVNRAEKRDWPRPRAEVGLRDEFMARHVTGGDKEPKPGTRHVAIPTRFVQRGPRGSVVFRDKPRQIRNRNGGFVTDSRGVPTGGASPAGDGLIRERVDAKLERRQKVEGFGRKRRQLSRVSRLDTMTLFLLRSKVRIDATWPFPKGVQGTVADRYPYHFRVEYEAAMRSARANAAKLSSDAGRFFYLQARRRLGGGAFPI